MVEKVERAVDEEDSSGSSDKGFYLLLGFIVVSFAILGLFIYFNSGSSPTTVSELHEKNLNGELSEDKGYMYNGFSFVKYQSLWHTKISDDDKNYEVPLHYGPKNLTNVNISGSLSDDFNQGEDVYVAINPLESDSFINVAVSELSQNMATAIKRNPVGACDRNETNACVKRDIVNCSETDEPTIYLRDKPGPKIELNGSCIKLKGEGRDLIKSVDYLLLRWYGVIS